MLSWPAYNSFFNTVIQITMFKIGNLSFSSPFILAPLAGYTDLPFRLLCKEFGADYVVSEMISCHGLFYKQKKTIDMLASVAEEKPLSIQLFGSEPDIMAEATQLLNDFQPDMIDINMGCPVRKVTKKGAGAALMSTPELAKDIIKAVVNNTNIPVTVKFRAGVNQNELNGVEFGLMAQSVGAAAVTVHGRTRAQGFSGFADRSIISKVKSALAIPVIGNGDILTYQDGLDMMEETGCDGVMIGRGALGNPWVFTPEGRPKSSSQIAKGALRHLALIEEFTPVDLALGLIRNHISKYFRDLPGSSKMRHNIFSAKSYNELKKLVIKISQ